VTPDEAHLTVGLVEYESLGRRRRGVVSGTLAALPEDASAPIYLHRNTAFRLPADPAADVVMIGAGTGVAPFRAFLADREAAGAKGRHWLFFGDRSFELDFLYQAEWLDWRKRGLLTRLDVAFSRDQAHKVYVQHRLAEHGAELWAWLEQGAHLYVCGDAARMAPDVEHALLDVIRRHGGRGSDDEARDYLLQLQRSRRYQRDVY
jgi:sulfite reductase (NADPH) flavoprotein alpha-component